MNKLKLVLGVLVVAIIGCQNLVNDESVEKDPIVITTINPSIDTQAQLVLKEALLYKYNKSTTSIDSLIAEIDYSEAILVQQEEGGISRYTFTLNAKEPLSYENLIVQVNEFGEYGAMIFRYEPDVDWLINNNGVLNQNDFTGTIRLLTIDRVEFNQVNMIAGEGLFEPVISANYKLLKTDCDGGSGNTSGGGGYTGEGGAETGGDTGGSGNNGSDGDGGGNESGNSESEDSSGGNNTSGGSSCYWYMEGVTLVIDCTPIEIDWPDILDEDPDDIIVTKSMATCDGQVEAPTIGDGDVIGTLGGDDVNLMEIIITDLSLHPCTEDLFNLIETVQQEGMRGVIDQFAGENSQFIYEIGIEESSNNFDNTNNSAESSWVNIDGNHYQTLLSLEYLNQATDLSIVRTLMHEAIHVYLLSLVDEMVADPSLRAEFRSNFPLLWDLYVNNFGNDSFAHHQTMAEQYVHTIKDALKEIFGARFSDQIYHDIAWGGLSNTKAFSQLDHQSKERIIIVNYNEDSNLNAAGSPCN